MSAPALPMLRPEEIAARWAGSSSRTGTLRLLTVQHEAAYEQMLATGRLVGDEEHVHEAYAAAYGWMIGHLDHGQKLAAVWGWARVDLPGLVKAWAPGSGADRVVLVAEIPQARALVSAFDPWQDLLDHHELPSDSWAACFELDRYPHSALQAVTTYVDRPEIVAAYRVRRAEQEVR